MSGTSEGWGSRLGLVLAMAGNAVGLGNFLRFPAQAAQNGGGAFLIPYLVSFVLMGLPLLWVEWAIGRHGGQFGHHSAPGMFDRLGKQPWLKYVGVLGLFTSMTVAAYYCYIESWTLAYVWHSVIGTFQEQKAADFFPQYLDAAGGGITALPVQGLFFFLLTLGLNVWVLSRGLTAGIERTAKLLMPLLLIFAAVLAVRGLTLPATAAGVVQSPLEGLNFVWQPQLSGLANPSTWLAAAGQVFFTLSLGMGSIHCYAAYLKKNDDIALNAASAGWLNEFVEVILGSAILIPIATAYLGLAAVQAATAGGSGFALGFLTLPQLFQNWGWFAPVAGALWFSLLFFAGITSSLAMGQPLLAFLEDEFGIKRKKAALFFGASTLVLGLWCVVFYPSGAFDEFDFWTGTFSLVVFALLEAFIFVWIFGIGPGWAEIERGADIKVPRVFRYVLQYVTPVFLLVVFLGALIKPATASWGEAISGLTSGQGWTFASDSVLGKILHVDDPDYSWFANGSPTRAFIQDMTRILLLLVFVGCSAMVALAWRRKKKVNE